jgi:AcrR family transcriptional regulator
VDETEAAGTMTSQNSTPDPDAEARRQARFSNRRDRSREEILDAAREVVLEKGVAGTTLAAVARAAGMSKTALYYYFPSKDALLFELTFQIHQARAQEVHDAVAETGSAPEALGALIDTLVKGYAARLDDFRLAFLYNQTATSGQASVTPEQFARFRPLNDLALAGTAERLGEVGETRAGVKPRLLAFLAQMAAVGVLTFKSNVEAIDDPLLYSDDEIVAALIRIFSAAAEPVSKTK